MASSLLCLVQLEGMIDAHKAVAPRAMRQTDTNKPRQSKQIFWMETEASAPTVKIGIHTQRPLKWRDSTAAHRPSISKSHPQSRPLRGSDRLYIHLPQLASLNRELSRLLIKDTVNAQLLGKHWTGPVKIHYSTLAMQAQIIQCQIHYDANIIFGHLGTKFCNVSWFHVLKCCKVKQTQCLWTIRKNNTCKKHSMILDNKDFYHGCTVNMP